MKKTSYAAFFILLFSFSALAQLTLPRDSQRQSIAQTVGDTTLTVVYYRPNVKGRAIWGGLEQYGEVWRTGANENTVFETSRDVSINGQTLPAGKYGLHTIPNKDEWIVIFNKANDQWGSFTYDEKKDALRIKVKPQTVALQETMSFDFRNVTANTADAVITWEKVSVPFKIDVGDVYGRTLRQIREAVKNRKADDVRPLNQGAGYVLTFKQKDSYGEAVGWLDESLKVRESFGTLNAKARILAEMGKMSEAIATAEKAVQVGKAATPPANTADLEKLLADWKKK